MMKLDKTSPDVMRVGVAVLLVLVVTVWGYGIRAQSGTLLVANSSVPGDALSKNDVRSIFLGKKSSVGDENVVIVTLSEGEAHKDFLKSVVGKTPSQFSSHWKRIVFTGKGKMPKEFNTEEELLAFVSNTPGGMGYVSGAASGDSRVKGGSVKVITIQE